MSDATNINLDIVKVGDAIPEEFHESGPGQQCGEVSEDGLVCTRGPHAVQHVALGIDSALDVWPVTA